MILIDEGSFRDRSARVLIEGDRVYRGLNHEAHAAYTAVAQMPFVQRMMSRREIVPTRMLSRDEMERLALPIEFAGLLEHERVPFVSYPFEWSFGMLRRAALLHLNVLSEALSCGFTLKDASPYNVLFRGADAVFIDVGSLVPLVPGEPWGAYRQFCEMMLFPLLLQAYRGVDFQSVLRGNLEGISARQFLQWTSWRDLLRPGVFTDGWMQSLLDRSLQATSTSTVRDLQSSGFGTDLIQRNIRRLKKLIERLNWKPNRTTWTDYRTGPSHVTADAETKTSFVRSICGSRQRSLVWDLGCNDGAFARLAAENAETVLAMDSDHGCVERLYRSLTEAAASETLRRRVLPLCVNMANLSPSLGWRGCERKKFEDRGRPELVLCLGLIHHLVISHNIPLPDVVEWLAGLGGEIVIEFPAKSDPMVQGLLRNKRDQYEDYSLEQLEVSVMRFFKVHQRVVLPSGHRLLLHAVPHTGGGLG
jgi:hypothetical protein